MIKLTSGTESLGSNGHHLPFGPNCIDDDGVTGGDDDGGEEEHRQGHQGHV